MRATLVFNPRAGIAWGASVHELLAALERAGFDPQYQPTAAADDLDELLARPTDLIVVAGGDGTVRAVAGRILGRKTPMAIVPLGTGNNIGTALGLSGVVSTRLIEGLASPRRRPFDLGLVHSPWGDAYFLESAGVGVFADLLQAYDPARGRSFGRALAASAQVVPQPAARNLQIVVDDAVLTGRYLLVEVMNTAYLGMRTPLAPTADPGDGMLDVVLVAERDDVGLMSYVRSLTAGDPSALPNWNVRRARQVTLVWEGSAVHVDETILRCGDPSPDTSREALIEFAVLPAALEVWLPGHV